MIIGVIFLIAGILIAIYPMLLSLIVASMLIFIGVFVIAVNYHYKRMSKRFDDPFMDFFIRF